MKHFLIILFCNFFCLLCYGQLLNSPESVIKDTITGDLYISNAGNGKIIKQNNQGIQTIFAENLTSVRGLYLLDRMLYCASNQGLAIYNLDTQSHILNVPVPGSSFLNDVVADSSGNVYISDSQANKIFKYNIASNTVNTFVSTGLQNPNGMVFDAQNNRLLLVSFRTNSPIQEISLPDGILNTVTITSISNADGIGIDLQGIIYISSWSNHCIYRLTDIEATPEVIYTEISGPADFCIYEEVSSQIGNYTANHNMYIPDMNANLLIEKTLPNSIISVIAHVEHSSGIPNPNSFITWVTQNELNLFAYNVYAHADSANFSTAEPVNTEPIPALNMENATYTLSDAPFNEYWWIEIVCQDGYTYIIGPIMAVLVNVNDETVIPPPVQFSIYPNPVFNHAFLKINSNTNLEASVSLYNIKGEKLTASKAVKLSIGLCEFSLLHIFPQWINQPSGVYIIHLDTGKIRIDRKFVKLK